MENFFQTLDYKTNQLEMLKKLVSEDVCMQNYFSWDAQSAQFWNAHTEL